MKGERHLIWYSRYCKCWFVNYTGSDIHGDFPTLPEAMDWLRSQLESA